MMMMMMMMSMVVMSMMVMVMMMKTHSLSGLSVAASTSDFQALCRALRTNLDNQTCNFKLAKRYIRNFISDAFPNHYHQNAFRIIKNYLCSCIDIEVRVWDQVTTGNLMMIDYHDFYYGDEERVDDSFVEDDEDVQDQVTAGGLSILSCWVKKIDDDCEDDSEYGDNDDDDDDDNDDDNHQISWWNGWEEAILSNCCTIAEAQAIVAGKKIDLLLLIIIFCKLKLRQ